MNDRDILRGLAEAGRRSDRELADLETEAPAAAPAVDRAVSVALRELEGARSGVVARRSRSGRGLAWAAAAAMAASFGFWVGTRNAPALPAYEIAVVAGGAQTGRGVDGEVPPRSLSSLRVAPGATLDVIARPASAVRRPVDGRAFLVHDGRAVPWAATIDTTPAGIVRARGTLGASLPLSSGQWTLAIVVGSRKLPDDPPALAGAVEGGSDSAGPGGDWRVVRIPLAAVPP